MGSAGDVFPMLGLGRRFSQLGHEVTVLTSDYFQRDVTNGGFHFVRLGEPGIYEASIQDPRLWHPTKSFAYLYETMCRPSIEPMFEIVREFSNQPNSITLINCFGFGALCAAEAHAAKVVTVHLQPSVLASLRDPPAMPQVVGPKWLRSWMLWLGGKIAIDPVVLPTLNDFRASKGLGPVRDVMHWWNSTLLNVLLFPEWFAKPAADWPTPFVQTSFPIWDRDNEADLPDSVVEFLSSGEPPVVVTGGSANVHTKKLFAIAQDVCQSLNERILYLSAKEDQLPDPLPSSAFVCPFVSLKKLLPKCKAVINHGGIGTASQTLAAGLPQVIIPLAHDQFDNGERITRLGLGRSLPSKRLTNASLFRCLKLIIEDRSMRFRCGEFASMLATERGVDEAVDKVIACIREDKGTS